MSLYFRLIAFIFYTPFTPFLLPPHPIPYPDFKRSIWDGFQAIYELNLPRVIVRTDSEYVCRCIAKYFNFWKQSDFCKASGDKVKYADELQELDRLLSMIEVCVY